MPAFTRKNIPELVNKLKNGEVSYPVYLIHGDRFLCQEAAQDIVASLLPDEKQRMQNLKIIDGDQEDPEQTLNLLRTFSLFPGVQIFRVTGSRLFLSKNVSKTLWSKAREAHNSKDPGTARKYLLQMLGAAGAAPEDFSDLTDARWKKLFGFAKPNAGISWASEALASAEQDKEPRPFTVKDDTDEQYISTVKAGIPANNILLLLAEAVDKRKKLYKYLQDQAAVIDLSVDSGASSSARKEQDGLIQELVSKTLAEFGKKIEPKAMALLLERVGFHPVAAFMETQKLALHDDSDTITVQLIDKVVGRTREEALFELTDAFASQNLERTIVVMKRLEEQGIHRLAILSTLRNHIRKLLLIRSIQMKDEPAYSPQPYNIFQKHYLPSLKGSYEQVPEALTGHPYALYKMFGQAEKFPMEVLRSGLSELLTAEYRLKSSSLPENIVMEFFIFSFFLKAKKYYYKNKKNRFY